MLWKDWICPNWYRVDAGDGGASDEFRQFLMRSLENAQIEWTLVCLAWNLKRMAVVRP